MLKFRNFIINGRNFLGWSEKSKMSWKSSHKIQKKSKNFWRAVGCNWQKNSVSFVLRIRVHTFILKKIQNLLKIDWLDFKVLIWNVLFCVLWKSYVLVVKNLYSDHIFFLSALISRYWFGMCSFVSCENLMSKKWKISTVLERNMFVSFFGQNFDQTPRSIFQVNFIDKGIFSRII